MLPKRRFNEDLIALAIGTVTCAQLRTNDVAPVGSESTYWLLRTAAERWHSFLLNAWARRGERVRMSIRQWVRDEGRPAIDPVAPVGASATQRLPADDLSAWLRWLVVDNSGANIEGVIPFDLRNTRREKAGY